MECACRETEWWSLNKYLSHLLGASGAPKKAPSSKIASANVADAFPKDEFVRGTYVGRPFDGLWLVPLTWGCRQFSKTLVDACKA